MHLQYAVQYSAQCLFTVDVCFLSAVCALSSRLAADSPPLCQNKCRNVCESGPINVIRQGLDVEMLSNGETWKLQKRLVLLISLALLCRAGIGFCHGSYALAVEFQCVDATPPHLFLRLRKHTNERSESRSSSALTALQISLNKWCLPAADGIHSWPILEVSESRGVCVLAHGWVGIERTTCDVVKAGIRDGQLESSLRQVTLSQEVCMFWPEASHVCW